MSVVLKLPPHHMTVSEFLCWTSDEGTGALWQLRDGEPIMMAPALDVHGSIQNELSYRMLPGLRNPVAGKPQAWRFGNSGQNWENIGWRVKVHFTETRQQGAP
jgi:hypothetical protein